MNESSFRLARTKLPSWLLVLMALLLAPAAQALTTFCVRNSAELRTATTSLVDDNIEIRLRAGVYPTDGQRFEWAATGSRIRSISGGWVGASSQCVSQLSDPAATLLDAEGSGSVLRLGQDVSATTGSLFLSNLSLTGGSLANGIAGCLNVTMDRGAATVLIDRIIVSGCQDTGVLGVGGVLLQNLSASTITLRNSLIANNLGGLYGGVSIGSNHADARTLLTNNTIVDNVAAVDGRAGGVAQRVSTVGIITLRNNAVIGNLSAGAALDLYFNVGLASSHVLRNNAAAVIQVNAADASGTLITNNPGFAGNGQYQLTPTSPLRNAGIALTIGEAGPRDLDFGLRVQGGVIDIGAYEFDGLFANGFE